MGELLATIGIGVINVLTTILAMMFVDKIGRKPLLIFGFFGTSVSLLVIFLAKLMGMHYMDWVAFGALIFYIFSFAISLGPLPYVYSAEIFPFNVRTMGMGLSSASNWFFNSMVVFGFPILSAALSVTDTFLIFAIICLFGMLYAIFLAPETKGLSLEAIQGYVESGKPLRRLSGG